MNNLDGCKTPKTILLPSTGWILITIRFLACPSPIPFIVAATQRAVHVFVSAFLFRPVLGTPDCAPVSWLELNTTFCSLVNGELMWTIDTHESTVFKFRSYNGLLTNKAFLFLFLFLVIQFIVLR
jgi:hypothetical protein